MKIFDSNKLLLIAGPCSLENEGICREVAKELVRLREKHHNLKIVFKGSFDKANRTSVHGKRGPGMKEGLKLLEMVAKEYRFAVTTDVHTVEQVKEVAEICDILQIPAFLCRQTDLLVAAAKTGKAINVKKGAVFIAF